MPIHRIFSPMPSRKRKKTSDDNGNCIVKVGLSHLPARHKAPSGNSNAYVAALQALVQHHRQVMPFRNHVALCSDVRALLDTSPT
eukprot:m.898940 g.898940  ORF g.898940 m.898940 type:complete len:85 (+) comp23676_c0_seq8:3083-3337(+)